MSATAPASPGDRAVTVGGDVVDSIIVTGDNVRIEVGAGGVGGTLLHLLGWRRKVRKRARPTPLDVRPGPFDGVDREQEAAALVDGTRFPLSVTGEALVGKTGVVQAALAQPGAAATPDGVLYVRGRGHGVDDLLQAIWEEFYDCRPPTKPSARERREDLAERNALVVVDDLELDHGDAQALAAALPSCRVALVSRERRLWDGSELRVEGLAVADALTLLERELGRPLVGSEREAALQLSAGLAGHPQRLRLAASIVARGGRTLGELARVASTPDGTTALVQAGVGVATEREREILAALEPFGEAPLDAEHLEALAGPRAGEAAAELVRLGLVVQHSPSYSAAAELASLLPQARREATRDRAVDYVEALGATSPAMPASDLTAGLSLLRRLIDWRRWEDVIRLGRALAPAVVLARRFDAWEDVARYVRAAAEELGDLDAQAWALHEQGTLMLSREDQAGRDLLRRALEQREQLGDSAGAAASRHNLGLPAGPPWYLRRIVHLPVIAIVAALAVLGSAGGGVAVAKWMDDGQNGGTTSSSTETAAQPIAVTIAVAGKGTVTGAAGAISCRERCTHEVPGGEVLELTAAPDRGWRFDGWSEPCALDPVCVLSPDRDVTVDARFAIVPPGRTTVRIVVIGSGTVTAGAAEPCRDDCARVFDKGATVDLRAEPDSGWEFVAWSGDCKGAICSLTLDGPAVATATFRAEDPVAEARELIVELDGGGTITSTPDGISCPETCRAEFDADEVTLRAEPDDGWRLTDWGATGCALDSADCLVRLDADVTVRPIFERLVTLTIEPPPEGGSISFTAADGATVTCPEDCEEQYPADTEIDLTGVPTAGFGPVSWHRDGCVDGAVCTVTLSSETTVSPDFPRELTLQLRVPGKYGGTVTLEPPPFTCDRSTQTIVDRGRYRLCTPTVFLGSEVVLTAVDTADAEFVRWAADAASCESSRDCRIKVDETPAVDAVFAPKPVLTLSVTGPVGSRVISDPKGLDCEVKSAQVRSVDCTASFARGTPVTLTPKPPTGVFLSAWGDACSGSGACEVALTASKTVLARFRVPEG